MKFDEVAILLACHTFQDFPVHLAGADADGLLAAWTALWHPLLIANSRKMPTWLRVDTLPSSDVARLVVLPPCHENVAADGLSEQVTSAGGRLIRGLTDRQEILAAARADWATDDAVDDELAAEFMALGYAYLQIELLTKRMRYSTRVLETAFADNLVSAADCAIAGDAEQTMTLLQSCYDFLSQERDHYYAVDVYLLDFALTAPTLAGEPLQRQLGGPTPTNVILSPELLDTLSSECPATWQALQTALAEERLAIIGGPTSDTEASHVSLATIDRQLQLALAIYERRLGQRPQVFGRRTFGLSSALPQLLLRHGFAGALHATFDGGHFPEATQAKSRWEGDGQFALDAIMRAPLDATQPQTFLNLATKLSETMDMDHIATRGFVHWAGTVSPWFFELQRATRYTRSLGKFVTVNEYFQETYDPGIHERCEAHKYRSPYFDEQIRTDCPTPISQWPTYWQRHLTLQSGLNAAALLALADATE
ncbi:MAG: hypothetical protein KDA92_20135, partial [Planctomycetales bacterium]|nr:hypothetical protein [Planctomycetales bacterium]